MLWHVICMPECICRRMKWVPPSCWISRFRPAISCPAIFWRALSPTALARPASALVKAHSSATWEGARPQIHTSHITQHMAGSILECPVSDTKA